MAKQSKESKIEKKLKETEKQYRELFKFAYDMIGTNPKYDTRRIFYDEIEEYRPGKRG